MAVRVDIIEYVKFQILWSTRTFGPGHRTKGLIKHIKKELIEIEKDPTDIDEWIDVVILGLDGAWRAGFTAEEIATALLLKQLENEKRKWPDWRKASEDEAIEHIREVPDLGMASGDEWRSMSVDERREAVRRSAR
jgi:hypothetical protein